MNNLSRLIMYIFLILSLFQSNFVCAQVSTRIKYQAVKNQDGLSNTLVANINSKKYVIFEIEKSNAEGYMLIGIEKVFDFDSDGYDDVLFYLSTGGNCCPQTYKIASAYPNGTYNVSKNDFSSWNSDFSIKRTENKWLISVNYNGEKKSYSYTNKDIKLERSVNESKIYAKFQILPEQIKDDGNDHLFKLDLNSDGRFETIFCRYWSRWGSILCGVKSSNGTILLEQNVGCDRFGVLESKSNGWFDIVCGNNLVFRYFRGKYRE